MKKYSPPIERYAALTSLEELQLEKLKLLTKIRSQETNIKEQVDEYLDIFRWIGNLSLVVKQVVSMIPFFNGFKLVFKFLKLFLRK